MALDDYQRALAAAAREQDLSAAELALLENLSPPDIAPAGRVGSSRCMRRARRAARLTLAALPEGERAAVVRDWLAQGGGASSLFEAEVEAFLAFIADRIDTLSHAGSLCQFERALHRARSARGADDGLRPVGSLTMIRRAAEADLVAFHAPMDALLEALAGKRSWPAVGAVTHRLLIAPGIAGLVRDANRAEIALWEAAELPVAAHRHWPTARSMIACGALEIVPVELV